jgi:hypothetical protein
MRVLIKFWILDFDTSTSSVHRYAHSNDFGLIPHSGQTAVCPPSLPHSSPPWSLSEAEVLLPFKVDLTSCEFAAQHAPV